MLVCHLYGGMELLRAKERQEKGQEGQEGKEEGQEAQEKEEGQKASQERLGFASVHVHVMCCARLQQWLECEEGRG